MRRRHPDNTNLKLYYEPVWRGLPVLARPNQALAENYLESIKSTLDRALEQHPRTCVIHFTARLPYGWQDPSGGLADRFIASLRAQIEADLNRKRRQGKRVHDCRVRQVWCREFGDGGQPHYHVAVMVNRDAYCTLGKFGTQPEPDYPWWLGEEQAVPNMAERILRAWSRALHLTLEQGRGLVHFPRNAVHLVSGRQDLNIEEFHAVFRRLSYLAKVNTKIYEDGYRNFGASRD